ncbi:ANTAR domain-containing protein [Streptomyces radiopugnans]|uniref:ANTAR domain-containing protein n=1 Tax=Streptomyces radiopugnans TaxID=403935 RepID=UPI003F1C2A22
MSPLQRVTDAAPPSPAILGGTGHASQAASAPERREGAELERLRAEVAQLRQAMRSRPVIDQARGMIMAWGACSADEAWRVLVRLSQHTNTKLRVVAACLVATVCGEPLPEALEAVLDDALHRRGPA